MVRTTALVLLLILAQAGALRVSRASLLKRSFLVGVGSIVHPGAASAGFFESLDEKARARTEESGADASRDTFARDGVDAGSSDLVQQLLKKTEENAARRKREIDVEMFEKSQVGMYGPGRKMFAVVDKNGKYQILDEFTYKRLRKEGKINDNRDLLVDLPGAASAPPAVEGAPPAEKDEL